MLINPVFNQNTDRPHRWALQVVDSGRYIEQIWMEDDRYIHWTNKTIAQQRDVYSVTPDNSLANFVSMRKKHIGFLTTQHRDFYEDGKYTEVWNDPINYITVQPTDYTLAYIDAERRIGNYRVGARRNIIHLGGTISDDQLDDLSTVVDTDFYPTTDVSFPFFPPKPTNYTQASRVNLLTTDAGFVRYLTSSHPSINNNETFVAEQGNGWRRFIWDSDDQTISAATLTDSGRVDIQDIETVLNAAVATDVAATDITTFLPVAGEDITINIPGQHIIRSNSSGLKLELYSDATLATLQSTIEIIKSSGNVILTAGDRTITIDSTAGTGTVNIT